jgi:hydroxyacyl-ACP dehydratase HTD2-like protein with hotdog domain
MPIVRALIHGELCTTGGSISRLQGDIYREAADLAYFLHWQRGDILGMTMRERRIWLSQITRIHNEQKSMRASEVEEHTEYIYNLKSRETGLQ